MAALIMLKAIVDELDGLSDEHVAYLHPQTGDLVTLGIEEIRAVEEDLAADAVPEWQQPLIAQARAVVDSNAYLQLPTRREIHEYAIMERFCDAVPDPHLRQIFCTQIRGSGAFRRFKQLLNRSGLTAEWYHFRSVALHAIARAWLEAHHIPYTSDDAERLDAR
jgi:Uncharacterised protein family (UPF0158)